MAGLIRITILVDNTANDDRLRAEHGFAVWVECGEKRLLFDAGQTDAVVHNARVLGIDLQSADAIVLSHGHYDHTGGLQHLLHPGFHPRLFVHPEAFKGKYVQDPDLSVRSIGVPGLTEGQIRSQVGEMVWTRTPAEVWPGVWVTGEIPRQTNFEDTGGAFCADAACTRPDALPDDQALFFTGGQGVIVLLGCAHAGVVNTLQYIGGLAGVQTIFAVIGGMHLKNALPKRISRSLGALQDFGVRCLVPAHCTGDTATNAFHRAMPVCCSPGFSGWVKEFALA
ncbi:MBL fold metallo-hydrolase [candidate division FCPU426 bacterium]|nr:MBL fold metallo-hydrolase [candidate division FCPU426 bacterium]